MAHLELGSLALRQMDVLLQGFLGIMGKETELCSPWLTPTTQKGPFPFPVSLTSSPEKLLFSFLSISHSSAASAFSSSCTFVPCRQRLSAVPTR